MLQNVWIQILSKVWMLVRKRQEALNAINSFVQNSKELQKEKEKRSLGSVLKVEPQSEDITQVPPSDGGCRGISKYQLRSVWQAPDPPPDPPPGPLPGPASGPPLPPAATPLDLGHVVVGEESLFTTKAARPPAWRIWADTTAQLYTSASRKSVNNRRWDPEFTFFDDVDDIISIEAELIGVLGVVGVQSFALRYLGFGFWCRFGSSSTGRRPTDRWSVSSDKISNKNVQL